MSNSSLQPDTSTQPDNNLKHEREGSLATLPDHANQLPTDPRTNGSGRPDVPQDVIEKWQHTINLMARTFNVPAALIMRVTPPEIEVFVASTSEGNPYEPGERASLNTGLYCETVMATRERLLVPDALQDPL